ncbi:MAG: hypothetical protein IJ328_05865 [Muribaculaceae bacterium]|nr:hypothetical protein [Muribaculaceae bacterium]
MKKIFTFILGVGTMLCANAQMAEGVQARIYAYDLQQEETTAVVNNTTVKAYNFTFKTNTAATGTPTVTLFGDGLNDVVIQATATDNTNKSWTATVHAANGEIVAGSYNWKVTVSADPVNSFSEIYNSKNNGFDFYRSYGFVVDQSPESNYFGRVYMAHQATSGTNVAVGMYTLTPELTFENGGKPYTACDMIGKGETSSSTNAGTCPADMCISKDGRIFMSNTHATYYGVYFIDPKDFSNSSVFKNITRDATNNIIDKTTSEHVAGKSIGITVRGYGDETVLITADATYFNKTYNDASITSFFINEYNIASNNQWTGAPSIAYGANGSSSPFLYSDGTTKVNFFNGTHAIDATTNGLWMAQYRGTPKKAEPSLFYYSNKTGYVEYSYYEKQSHNNSAALAVNEDLGLVAHTIKGDANATIMQYSEDEEGQITMNQISTGNDMAALGTKADAMSFDYAGNLYAITSGNEIMAVYALPDALVGENTRTTPAKSTLLAEFSDGDKLTSIDGINADANAPVEYYNLQGVKVENPEKGIFIKKQGSKTTKVVF